MNPYDKYFIIDPNASLEELEAQVEIIKELRNSLAYFGNNDLETTVKELETIIETKKHELGLS